MRLDYFNFFLTEIVMPMKPSVIFFYVEMVFNFI